MFMVRGGVCVCVGGVVSVWKYTMFMVHWWWWWWGGGGGVVGCNACLGMDLY